MGSESEFALMPLLLEPAPAAAASSTAAGGGAAAAESLGGRLGAALGRGVTAEEVAASLGISGGLAATFPKPVVLDSKEEFIRWVWAWVCMWGLSCDGGRGLSRWARGECVGVGVGVGTVGVQERRCAAAQCSAGKLAGRLATALGCVRLDRQLLARWHLDHLGSLGSARKKHRVRNDSMAHGAPLAAGTVVHNVTCGSCTRHLVPLPSYLLPHAGT